MKNEVHIGCSSFYNKHWKKVFYPEDIPSAKWFEYYCQFFDTYEMNATFYKFPTIRSLENWYKKSPENFLYSVKAPREITHVHKFIDCKDLIDDLYSRCKMALKDKLACILFQFPPSYHFSEERLDQIIANLDLSFANVIEFRHPSWWIREVWDAFSKNNITFCSVSHPRLPNTIFTNPDLIYIRLHGKPEMFYSYYTAPELTALKAIIDKKKNKKVFVYFNNTASAGGILNALDMKKL